VLIMRGGQLALDSRLDAIGARPRLLVTLDRPISEVRESLAALDGVSGVTHLGDSGAQRRFALECEDARRLAPLVAQTAASKGWALYELAPERRDLEALFGTLSAGGADLAAGAGRSESAPNPMAEPDTASQQAAPAHTPTAADTEGSHHG
jgi:ABC-2 type transport system ATP-binding protein